MMTLKTAGSKRRTRETRRLLAAAFPNCFCGFGAPKKPLKLGIANDVMARLPEIGFFRLSMALTDYCGGPMYLKQIIEGADRVDLDGQPAGTVDAEQAKHAASRLTDYYASTMPPATEAAAQPA
jgi:ProP effector